MRTLKLLAVSALFALGTVTTANGMSTSAPGGLRAAIDEQVAAEPVHCRPGWRHWHRWGWGTGCRRAWRGGYIVGAPRVYIAPHFYAGPRFRHGPRFDGPRFHGRFHHRGHGWR